MMPQEDPVASFYMTRINEHHSGGEWLFSIQQLDPSIAWGGGVL